MSLPFPGIDFIALDVLTAAEMDQLVANIEALAAGTGFAPGAVPVLRDIKVYESNTTWSKPTDMQNNGFVVSIVVGGGGAGGWAVATSGGGSLSSGGGGGGGGYSLKLIPASALGASETVTIGAGGVATISAAGAGGTSSFGSHHNATGGTGGSTGTANGQGSQSGTGGVGSGGLINLRGQEGLNAWRDTNRTFAGVGGTPAGGLGTGGNAYHGGSTNTAVQGGDGNKYGGGGGGAANSNTQTARRGGHGAIGGVIVYEYY